MGRRRLGPRPDIAGFLRAARAAAGLSQADLASRAGLGRGTVKQLEVGGCCLSPQTAAALERGLGLEPGYLLRYAFDEPTLRWVRAGVAIELRGPL